MSEPMSEERLAEIGQSLTHDERDSACIRRRDDTPSVVGVRCYLCFPNHGRSVCALADLLAEVEALRAALQAPLLHGSTAGYVYIDYEDDEDMYIDSRRVAPDLDTAREWAGRRKVFALMDLSNFGEPDD